MKQLEGFTITIKKINAQAKKKFVWTKSRHQNKDIKSSKTSCVRISSLDVKWMITASSRSSISPTFFIILCCYCVDYRYNHNINQ